MKPKPLFFLFILFFFAFNNSISQFAPAAGKAGSTALRYDSTCFVNWGKSCSYSRMYMDISKPDSGFASVGDSISPTGKALQNGVLSLGDGGSATLQFEYPLRDESGWDFAVFENSFLDTFLELAFVEVSSDGIHFVRFPAISLSDTSKQTGSFGATYPEKINNLAGKYRAGFGTPFDLDELKDSAGIDILKITHVRIVDVVGSLLDQYARRDAQGNKINDPWPTRFPSSGFDLDAVGVIHQDISANVNSMNKEIFSIENPVLNQLLKIQSLNKTDLHIYDLSGRQILKLPLQAGYNEVQGMLKPGAYLCKTGNCYSMIIVE